MSALYLEASIAEKLGVTRDELISVRSGLLQKKTDWEKKGRQVALTESGLKIVRAYFSESGLATPDNFEDCRVDEKKKAADKSPVELVVVKRFPNVGLLLATTPAGEEVRVRVRDNRNFRPDMKINAKPPSKTGPQIYRMEGRCPRFPGRW